MLIRQTILVAAAFTALLGACQKKDVPLPETAASAASGPSVVAPASTPPPDAATAAPATEGKKATGDPY